MAQKNKSFEISQPIKWTIAAGLGFGLVALYKKMAPVPRMGVVINPNKIRKERVWHSTGFDPYTISWQGEFVLRDFNAKEAAAELRECMTGATTSFECQTEYDFLMLLNQTELRHLHNMWLKYVDKRKSLFDWINAEITTSNSEEQLKQRILQNLTIAGVGLRNALIVSNPVLIGGGDNEVINPE